MPIYKTTVRFEREFVISAKNAEEADDKLERLVEEVEMQADVQCLGTGYFEDDPEECAECKGSGLVGESEDECPKCHGDGEVPFGQNACQHPTAEAP